MFNNLRRISLDHHLLLRTKLKIEKFIKISSCLALFVPLQQVRIHEILCFVKINYAENVAENNMIDDYGTTIVPGHKFFQAKYLEKLIEKKHSQVYKSIYPFVTFKEEKDKYIIDYNELCEVIAYVEYFGLVSL